MLNFRNLPPVVKNLLIVNVLVWAFVNLVPSADGMVSRMLSLHYFSSPGFGVWQVFTYMFVHFDFMHMFFNMFALFMFGSTIEMSMGSRRFLFYYVSCGIFAGLMQLGVFALMISQYRDIFSADDFTRIINEGWRLMNDSMAYVDPSAQALNSLVNSPMVGASGAVFGVILAFGMLYPNQPIYIWFIPVPIKSKYLVIGYAVLELAYGVTGVQSSVAHFAHLGGMLIGLIMILYWKRRGVFTNRWFF